MHKMSDKMAPNQMEITNFTPKTVEIIKAAITVSEAKCRSLMDFPSTLHVLEDRLLPLADLRLSQPDPIMARQLFHTPTFTYR